MHIQVYGQALHAFIQSSLMEISQKVSSTAVLNKRLISELTFEKFMHIQVYGQALHAFI